MMFFKNFTLTASRKPHPIQVDPNVDFGIKLARNARSELLLIVTNGLRICE